MPFASTTRVRVTQTRPSQKAKRLTMADDDQQGNGNYYNEGNISHVCASWAPMVGFAGIASAVVFASKWRNATHGHRQSTA